MSARTRNIGRINEAPRCGARTRTGTSCQSPAISGKSRRRMHGGKGSGAPNGNRDSLRHGAYTKDVIEREQLVHDLCRRLRCATLTLTSINQPVSIAEAAPSTKESPQ
jgi:glucans biosynthesis protein